MLLRAERRLLLVNMAGSVRKLAQNFARRPKSLTSNDHCMNLVRESDYENYMSTLLLPRELIPPAIAIRAFNVEVARVEDVVKDKRIGEMRLQFFLDELNKVFEGRPRSHPVLLQLHKTLRNTRVSKHYLKRLVESRLQRIRQPEFPTLEAIDNYAEQSVSSIFYMLLQLQNVADMHIDHYASHIGKAQGIVTVLRSIPYYRSKRINVLPGDVLLNHGLSTEAIFRKTRTDKLHDCVYDIASQAAIHLNKANALEMKGKVNKQVRKLFLSRIFTERYLERLRRVDFDVYNPKLVKQEVTTLLKLLWTGLL